MSGTVIRIGWVASFNLRNLSEITVTEAGTVARSEGMTPDGLFIYPLTYRSAGLGRADAAPRAPYQGPDGGQVIDVALMSPGLYATADSSELPSTLTVGFSERGVRHTVSGMPATWWTTLQKKIGSAHRGDELIYSDPLDRPDGQEGPTMSGKVQAAGAEYVDFAEVRSFGIVGSADGYEVYCLRKGGNEEKTIVTVQTPEVATAIMEGLGEAKHHKRDVDLLELITRSYEEHIANIIRKA